MSGMTGSWVTLRQSCQRLGGVDIVLLIQIKQSASEDTHRVPPGAAPSGRKIFLRVINGLGLEQAADPAAAFADQDTGDHWQEFKETPMIVLRMVLATTISVCFTLLSPRQADAFELAGAWATSADQCAKVFARKGRANRVSFTNFSGMYGGGFIAESDRLKGKFESCAVKSRKESGQTINLVVACASGVMLSNVQFFLKVIDDNTIFREFPGMEGMDVKYHRCQI
jgi:hypothetical protein